MVGVFSGGLVYEFTEEPNNYGLVKILPDGNVRLLEDFHLLRKQYLLLGSLDSSFFETAMSKYSKNVQSFAKNKPCNPTYKSLEIGKGLPPSMATTLIQNRLHLPSGKLVALQDSHLRSPHHVFDVDGINVFMESPKVEVDVGITSKWGILESARTNNGMYPFVSNDSPYDSEYYDDSGEESQIVVRQLSTAEQQKAPGLMTAFHNTISSFFSLLLRKAGSILS